jgi:hypothetical protein
MDVIGVDQLQFFANCIGDLTFCGSKCDCMPQSVCLPTTTSAVLTTATTTLVTSASSTAPSPSSTSVSATPQMQSLSTNIAVGSASTQFAPQSVTTSTTPLFVSSSASPTTVSASLLIHASAPPVTGENRSTSQAAVPIHASAPAPLDAVIGGVGAAVFLLAVVAVIGVIMWKRKRDQAPQTATSLPMSNYVALSANQVYSAHALRSAEATGNEYALGEFASAVDTDSIAYGESSLARHPPDDEVQ